MNAGKIQAKIFVESPAELDVTPLVPVFHEWIQKNALGELLIDVTEYGHVHHGPSLLLVGHESDYVVDFAEGRAGLVCNRKRVTKDDPESAVLDAVRRVLAAARRLEGEAVTPPVRFRGDELLLHVNDRLAAPNTRDTFTTLAPAFEKALKKVYAGTAFTLEQLGTPRELFTVRVLAKGAPAVAELLARIS
ncbi:MAG TPA: hypothetical protein VH062_30205 [Polyangiaceae bacterium]|jgi:hypothetical protein|nr:hypothetical protein [Polyangiaceae bacterium]